MKCMLRKILSGDLRVRGFVRSLMTMVCFFVGSAALFAQGYSGGAGTEADPFKISTRTDLEYLAGVVNAGDSCPDVYFVLTDTINMQVGGADLNFIPIGKVTGGSSGINTPFSGVFDGQGYAIENLYINRPGEDGFALFGATTTATIKNLGLTNVNISGDGNLAALIAIANRSTIQNCYSTGTVTATGIGGGGLIASFSNFRGTGYSSGVIVSDCWSSVVAKANSNAGGLIASTGSDVATHKISNCYATGEVETTDANYAGGLIGYVYYSIIENCYATGKVTSKTNRAGGLLGIVLNECRISDCYATGDVYSGSGGGGFTGYVSASTIERCYATGNVTSTGMRAGGFIDQVAKLGIITDCYARGNANAATMIAAGFAAVIGDNTASMTNCYSTGVVTTPGANISGFCNRTNGTITNCYYDEDNNPDRTADTYNTPMSTASMKTAAFVAMLNVTTDRKAWREDYTPNTNDGYPIFRGATTEPPVFSVAGGDYNKCVFLSLSCPTDGAEIYYTLDGSTPSDTSLKYVSGTPLHLSTTVTVTAIAKKTGWAFSDTRAETYNIIISDDDDFTYSDNDVSLAYAWNGSNYAPPTFAALPLVSDLGNAITYTTFDNDVIDIDNATGVITVKKAGTVKITGVTTATVKTTRVFGIKIEKATPSISLSMSGTPITIGSERVCYLLDQGVTNTIPTVWYGSNSNGAVVGNSNDSATVTAVKPGQFQLTATLQETEITKTVTILADLTFIRNTTTLEIDNITKTYEPSLVVLLNAVTNSPAPVKYTTTETGLRIEGSAVYVTSAGTYTIVAAADTTVSHQPAEKTFTLTVLQAQQTLEFLPVADVYFEAEKQIPLYAWSNNPDAVITFAIVSGPGKIVDSILVLPETLTDTRIVIQASAAADINYNAATAVQSVTLLEFPVPPEPATLSAAYVLGNKISMIPDSFHTTDIFSKKTKFLASYQFITPKKVVKMKKTPVKTVPNQMDTNYAIEVKGKVLLLNKKNYNALRKTGKTTAEILADHNDTGAVQVDSIPVYVQYKLGKTVSADSVCIPALAPVIDSCYIGQFVDNNTRRDFLIVRLSHPSTKPKGWIEYRHPTSGKVMKMALPFYSAKKTAMVLGLNGACQEYSEGMYDVIVFKLNPKYFSIAGTTELVINNQNGYHAIKVNAN